MKYRIEANKGSEKVAFEYNALGYARDFAMWLYGDLYNVVLKNNKNGKIIWEGVA